ncbi:RNA-binding motif protein, Y chromosome, family 1 member B [Ananas comosus]|uniref:RNA-binding motif protein, Y chromosome, family 1 member B n=1 Tax=Ananas comosus TaxID=4615 RepID=A0A6P5EM70_ANACO|nr:RNA-binding motif protein, Y chromosome, family 1 member B [Ananas comosus]
MATAAASFVPVASLLLPPPSSSSGRRGNAMGSSSSSSSFHSSLRSPPLSSPSTRLRSDARQRRRSGFAVACVSPTHDPASSAAATKLYVSGLSFRTTQESLRNAFEKFGQLVEVNLVMDRVANRPRGFAFLRYATEEESKKAIEGMHGKFLDGRVIFVEVAKPRSELRRSPKQSPRSSSFFIGKDWGT